jgi:lipopolysaccharide transport system ATP-binding protein
MKKTDIVMSDDVVLRVENLSKKFCRTLKRSMYYGTIDIARSMIGIPFDTANLRKDEFWALDDISFELKKGETLGIIGVNGSGKSTLLRLITGIFPPDKGKIICRGRVGALIAVGAGFHPHMTGRENIYLNGTILGMSRKEIDLKIDEIIEFAEIGEFIDSPVNNYSSGMRVRLGFAIAVHCEPDILLVDEILSVGDISFRKKSMDKMESIRKNASVIFISHNLYQIERICSRALLLKSGKIVFQGKTNEVINQYYNTTFINNNLISDKLTIIESTNDINNLKIDYLTADGKSKDTFLYGDSIIFYFEFNSIKKIQNTIMGFVIKNIDGVAITSIKNINFNNNSYRIIKKGKNIIRIKLMNNCMLPGGYTLHLKWKTNNNTMLIEALSKKFIILADANMFSYDGVVKLKFLWKQV